MDPDHIEGQEPEWPFYRHLVEPVQARAQTRKEPNMREWQKPVVEETESGMEVTSYLPAELDRA